MAPLPRNRSFLVVHALAAPNYSLAAPDFAKPALAQTHVLKADTYVVQSPDFGFGEPGQNHQLEPRRRRTGRPPAMTTAVKRMLIAELESWLLAEQAKRFRRLRPADIVRHAQSLAKAAGVHSSDFNLKRDVIRPALRNIRTR